MGVITKEELERINEVIEKRIREIREFTPLVNFELNSFNEIQFIQKVCKGEFDFVNAKEGDYMFRCSLSNKRYFHRLNSRQTELLNYTKEIPLIEVEVAGLARFAVRCPNVGTSLCRMANSNFYLTSRKGEETQKEQENLSPNPGIKLALAADFG